MRFQFTVTVSVEREAGKFAGRDELAEQLIAMIEQANEGTIDGVGADGESAYTIEDFEVEEVPQVRRRRKP